MASFSVPPLKDASWDLFVKTHRAKPRPPPATTSFAGQTAIVTGSNSGIGLAAAQEMLKFGLTHLIIAVRSASKGEIAAATLRNAHPNSKIEVWEVDMISSASVQAFAKRCGELNQLDIAILNAGISKPGWVLTPDGHEQVFQVNYLYTALLAILLLPLIKAKRSSGVPGRLCIVSSGLALGSQFSNRNEVPLLPSFDDPKKWARMDRYALSKTLVLMLASQLSEVISADEVVVNVVDPGLVTGTGLNLDQPLWLRGILALMKAASSRSMQQGAWTYLDAVAVKGKETHGGFVVNWELYPYHSMMYTEEGKGTTQRLWEETIEELSFAGVKSILQSLK
ncbi:hypothetical protein AK830_g5429 [Neonectria ditissima]|uniref:WW domain-containing oxidoreductase n=1 Tax=Neonectria ditissima TaxID=78410 RepID=A0A0P7BL87_9HYPO|nr:hypothetical protein AK830_g5429 [Neonectria ditissima]